MQITNNPLLGGGKEKSHANQQLINELHQFYEAVCRLVLRSEDYADININQIVEQLDATTVPEQMLPQLKHLHQALISKFQSRKNQHKKQVESIIFNFDAIQQNTPLEPLVKRALDNWKLSVTTDPISGILDTSLELFEMTLPVAQTVRFSGSNVPQQTSEQRTNEQKVSEQHLDLRNKIAKVVDLMRLSNDDAHQIIKLSRGHTSEQQLLMSCRYVIDHLLNDLRVEERLFSSFFGDVDGISIDVDHLLKSQTKLHEQHQDALQSSNDNIKLECLNIEDSLLDYDDAKSIKTVANRASQRLQSYIKHREQLDHSYQAQIEHFLRHIGKLNNSLLSILKSHQKQFYQRRNTANVDTLTRLPSRSSFEEKVRQQIERVISKKGQAQLLMIDLDGFKPINDNFGHPVGDKTLKIIARTINHIVPERGFVCRWGGDEFMILLANMDHQQSLEFANTVCSTIQALPLKFKQNAIKITASIGAISIESSDTPKSLTERVDKALYQAKNNGGDQVSSIVNTNRI